MEIEEIVTLSHRGRVRDINEDLLLKMEHIPLLAIADGTGGAGKGDLAAQLAITEVEARAIALEKQVRKTSQDNTSRSRLAIGRMLGQSIEHASILVRQEAERHTSDRMGTSLLLTALAGDDLHIAHVGNCRAYLLRQGELMPLTDDHTVAMFQYRRGRLKADALAQSPLRNRLYQVVGGITPPEPDIAEVSLASGDILLLCTDGLHGVVPEDRINELLSDRSLAEAGEALLQAALERGGPDNVSLLLARFGAGHDQPSVARRAEILRSVFLFSGLDEAERRLIAPYLERRTLPANTTLFTEGNEGEGFYLILSGSIAVTRRGVHLMTLGPGQHLGELSLAGKDYTITATTQETTTTFSLSREHFQQILQSRPELGVRLCMALIDTLGERVRVLAERVAEQATAH